MSRRARGEGTIFHYRNGWAAQVDTSELRGPRKRRTIYGKTQDQVREELDRITRSRDLGTLPDTGDLTTEQYLRHWLEYVKKPHLRRSTFDRYRRVVENDLIPVVGAIRLDRLRPSDVRVVIARLENAGAAAATANYPRSVLRSALADAVSEELLTRNVAALVKPAAGEAAEHEPFSEEEARRFIEAVEGHRLRALWLVALSLGLRRGEVLGLRWQDVDEAAGQLRVRQSVQYVEREVVIEALKTKKSRRDLVLPGEVADILHEYHQAQLAEQLRTGRRWPNTGLVFVNEAGEMLRPYWVSAEFKRILKHAGLREVRFYDLRHSAATFMLAAGVDLKTISTIFGHSSIKLTGDTYTKVVDRLKREAAAAMSRTLFVEARTAKVLPRDRG